MLRFFFFSHHEINHFVVILLAHQRIINLAGGDSHESTVYMLFSIFHDNFIYSSLLQIISQLRRYYFEKINADKATRTSYLLETKIINA